MNAAYPADTLGAAGGELMATELAELAAEAVRAINHLTRPGAGGLPGPAEAADILAALAAATARLPQLFGQLCCWLVGEQHAGRLRVDAWSGWPDPAAAVAAATAALPRAARCAAAAGRELDTAHQCLAHLAATTAVSDAGEDNKAASDE